MGSIEIRAARKFYGANQVLHDVDFAIMDGEFIALVGPSGCGKSTLLRMIAGLESISGGEIVIGGKVVNDLSPKDRDIAMVFQNYALYPSMTVAQNMGFALRMAKAPKSQIDRSVARAAEILGLEDLLDRLPRQLSGGQRQRVAMGRAIVRDPQVFLFDEPLSNLDAKLRVQMRAEIKSLHQRLTTTTIYVTHDQIEALTMADRIVVMRAGHIEQIGTPLDLYDSPVNIFVAGFIGSPAMNQLRGRILVDASGASFDSGHAVTSLPGYEGGPVEDAILGIRPEHMAIAEHGFAAHVRVVEPTGYETLVYSSHGDQQIVMLLHERVDLKPGQPLHVRPTGDVHLFDGGTGARITTLRS